MPHLLHGQEHIESCTIQNTREPSRPPSHRDSIHKSPSLTFLNSLAATVSRVRDPSGGGYANVRRKNFSPQKARPAPQTTTPIPTMRRSHATNSSWESNATLNHASTAAAQIVMDQRDLVKLLQEAGMARHGRPERLGLFRGSSSLEFEPSQTSSLEDGDPDYSAFDLFRVDSGIGLSAVANTSASASTGGLPMANRPGEQEHKPPEHQHSQEIPHVTTVTTAAITIATAAATSTSQQTSSAPSLPIPTTTLLCLAALTGSLGFIHARMILRSRIILPYLRGLAILLQTGVLVKRGRYWFAGKYWWRRRWLL